MQREPAVGNLAADAHQSNEPELDMLAVQPAVEIDVVQRDRSAFAGRDAQANAFVDNLAVPLGVSKRVCEPFGRGHHIIDKADLANIEVVGEVKAKKVVAEFLGREFHELDLRPCLKARGIIFDCLWNEARLNQDAPHVFAVRAQFCTCQARYPAGGSWNGA